MNIEKLKNYSNFIKIEHTVFALPFALSAYLIVIQEINFNAFKLVLIIIALISARTYGMAINRIIDKDIDSINPRTKMRELVTKKVSNNGALLLVVLALLTFYLSLIGLERITLLLSPIVIGIFTIYPLAKRFTFMSHYILGLVYLIAPPAVEISLTGNYSLTTLILGFAGFFWVSGFDIIYSILDIDFDRENNLHSIPSKFGVAASKVISWISHFFTILLISYIGILEGLGLIFWIGCTILLGLFIKEHLLILKINKKNVNKAFFDMNARISFLILLTFSLSTLI